MKKYIIFSFMCMGLSLNSFAQTSAGKSSKSSSTSNTQSNAPALKELTGIWRGTFTSNNEMGGQGYLYKYEVQFLQKSNGALRGVTYSWQNNIGWYGKANGSGIYMQNANSLILKEEELEEIKNSNGGEGCLMTCYMDYEESGGRQFLVGTYSSVESRNRRQSCPGGTVRLEKVPDSDFGIEPYVMKRLQEIQQEKKANIATVIPSPAPKKIPVQRPPVAAARPKLNVPPPTPKRHSEPAPNTPPVTVRHPPENNTSVPVPRPATPKKIIPPPPVFTQRSTVPEKTFVVNDPNVKISFYDMGEIDGDIISVYLDNQPVLSGVKLTGKGQSIQIPVTADDKLHEITVVAESLGTIPPNTAFVLIESGGKRYEITLTSDMTRNARILIEYKP